jgi:hypothetical protein
MDIDDVFRDAAPAAGHGATDRIARGVMARLERRKRRTRTLRRGGVVLVVGAAAIAALVMHDRPAPPDVPAIARVEAPVAPPTPAPRRSPKKPLERRARTTASAQPPAADPVKDLRDRVAREARGGDRSRVRRLAGEVARSGLPDAWPLLDRVIEALGPDAAAIEAAGEIADPRAVPYLARSLRLADRRAALAADALARIPGDGSLAALVEAHERMRGAEGTLLPEVRKKVALALREREDEVLGLLLDARPDGPQRLLRTLADLRTPAALAAVVESLERPALRALARQLLARVAGRDLGPEPARWQRWLMTEAFGPAGPGADTRSSESRREHPIARAGRTNLTWRWNA